MVLVPDFSLIRTGKYQSEIKISTNLSFIRKWEYCSEEGFIWTVGYRRDFKIQETGEPTSWV